MTFIALAIVSLALYALGVIMVRSYDAATEFFGVIVAWIGVGLFVATGFVSAVYVAWMLL